MQKTIRGYLNSLVGGEVLPRRVGLRLFVLYIRGGGVT
jgi:hypothetical protein